jgi:catechol 2,3-dioxygenase-like lactoylglutathione lyase family enzyme
MTLRAEDLYHTGIVVNDLEGAIERMSMAGGYRFTKLRVAPMRLRTPEGILDVTFRFVYSLQVPHIELVASIAGTVWVPAPNNATHHLGYFVDDLGATSNELEAAGFVQEACGLDHAEPAVFAYYRDESGIRIELVDRARFPDGFDAYLRSNTLGTDIEPGRPHN